MSSLSIKFINEKYPNLNVKEFARKHVNENPPYKFAISYTNQFAGGTEPTDIGFGFLPEEKYQYMDLDNAELIYEAGNPEFEEIPKVAADSFTAVKNNDIDSLKIIAKSSPQTFSKKNNEGQTVAMIATKKRFTNCLQVIADSAPDSLSIQSVERGYSPAMFAVEYGYADCLKIIAEKSPATLSIPDKEGYTTAHEATSRGYLDCLKILSDFAPQTFSAKSKTGVTPLSLAKEDNKNDFVKLIEDTIKNKNNSKVSVTHKPALKKKWWQFWK